MLGTLRNAADPQNIELDQEFYRDLKWFQEFLPHFNGVYLYSHKCIEGVVQVDASLQSLGGRWGNQVYQLSIPDSFFGLGIVQLEMLIYGCRLAMTCCLSTGLYNLFYFQASLQWWLHWLAKPSPEPKVVLGLILSETILLCLGFS